MSGRPIPPSKWVWCGYAGHFCAADSCRFHLHTRVGDYRISTVGDYFPPGRSEAEEIGLSRYFETYVFHVSGNGVHGEGEPVTFSEIDSEGYGKDAAKSGDVEAGHFKMCRKYARVAVGLEPEGCDE